MVEYLTNFAKTGDPNGEGLPVWETAQSSGQGLWLDAVDPMMSEIGKEI